jgi:hypothetical protein
MHKKIIVSDPSHCLGSVETKFATSWEDPIKPYLKKILVVDALWQYLTKIDHYKEK